MFDFEYVGNLHIHSRRSDGSGNIAEIARFAEDGELDFICVNDHDFMTDDLHLEEEGYYGKVMVFVGLEIGRNDHHYLAYGLKRLVRGDNLKPQDVIDRTSNTYKDIYQRLTGENV